MCVPILFLTNITPPNYGFKNWNRQRTKKMTSSWFYGPTDGQTNDIIII